MFYEVANVVPAPICMFHSKVMKTALCVFVFHDGGDVGVPLPFHLSRV